MSGLTFEKLLIILAIAAFVIGPERLPGAVATLRRAVRRMRGLSDETRRRLRDDAGIDLADWRTLDPRRYDPRRVIRDALMGDDAAHPPSAGTSDAR
ncbi:Sec-independent protein translocase TatB [Leifsonia sp. H3M29-4]|uniref:Sec-independent protein translocase TatB n=1 Tax=Salinibacterium metalliresistens TaxID=3031321 RepID=UPI0023DC372D|nr:Sec-independent protein translocase TatB [Salinibacterium metalliresistens]MDF1477976.1 Sec-independent protein translocase TatB [Salinibacterium metalliresistens]